MTENHEPLSNMTFYRSYYDSLKALPMESRTRLYDSIFYYGFEGQEPSLEGVEAVIFGLIRPTIDSSIKKHIKNVNNGRKHTAHTKGEPNNDPEITQMEPKTEAEIRELEIRDLESRNVESRELETNFNPPSIIEVQSYIEKNGYLVNADSFIDYYSSRNWMIGNTKIVDWQAKVREWNRRKMEDNNTSARKNGTTDGITFTRGITVL